MTIGIIGAGNMGSALCEAFVNNSVVQKEDIMISDPSQEKLLRLSRQLGIKTSNDNKKTLMADVIFLAVKPQVFFELAGEIRGKINSNSILVSIMAGISIENIRKQTSHEKVVRAMPNIPIMVGHGVIGWSSNESITNEEKNSVQRLLEAGGYAFEVKNEESLNDVTALSGAGPGFFFYIIEQWMKASKSLNISNENKTLAIVKTLEGSLKLLEQSEESPENLRKKVSSKGGSTEKGLNVLAKAHLKKIFSKMIQASKKRCQNLN